MCYLLAGLLLFSLALDAPAGEKPHPHVRALAPLIDEQTLAIVHLDLKQLNLAGLYKELAKKLQLDTRVPEKFKELLVKKLELVHQSGLQHVYLLVNLSDIPAAMPLLVVIGPEGKDQEFLQRIWRELELPGEPVTVPGQNVVAGPAEQAQRLLGGQAVERPEFFRALDRQPAAGGQMVAALPASMRRAIRETLPSLPAAFGGVATGPLLDGFQLAHLRFDGKPKLQIQLAIEMKDADSAKQLEQVLEKGLTYLRQQPEVKKHLAMLEPLLKAITPKRTGGRVEAGLSGEQFEQIVQALVIQLQTGAERMQTFNHLKQIGIAVHIYHDVNKELPPAVFRSKDGMALLSWRVHLLPYLDQEKLYRQFKLNEPWDSPHNKTLIDKMPAVFRSPRSKAGPGKTTYLAPVNATTMWGDPKVKRILDIHDGTSNTIMLVEVDDNHAVIWTKPEDLQVDPRQPLRGLRFDEAGVFATLFADGSVRALPRTITPAILNALFSARGGEVVPAP